MQKRRVRRAAWWIPGTAVLALGQMAPAPAGAQLPAGAQFQVNTYTTNSQGIPSVARAADADFVEVWRSGGSPGTDTSGYSIQGQRYSGPPPVPAMSSATRFALGAALLLLGAACVSWLRA